MEICVCLNMCDEIVLSIPISLAIRLHVILKALLAIGTPFFVVKTKPLSVYAGLANFINLLNSITSLTVVIVLVVSWTVLVDCAVFVGPFIAFLYPLVLSSVPLM